MSHNSDHPIGVFDSGIGGLTVAAALRKRLPGEDIIYLGDTARVPYGTKSVETVKRYAMECSLYLLNKGVKLIVIACNTASAVALDHLQAVLRVPIIGVVEPGVKAALRIKGCKNIGIMGTPATIASSAYQKRLKELSPSIEAHSKACPLLVPLIEEGRLDGKITEAVLEDYLKTLKRKHIDSLILGCTHYPLLKPIIAKVIGEDTKLIDSAEVCAEEVEQALLREGLLRTHGHGSIKCCFTDIPKRFNRLGKLFFGEDVGRVKKVVLEG